jgi:hypothetical protein
LDPTLETIEIFEIPIEYRTTLGDYGVNFIIHRVSGQDLAIKRKL